jgi:hypothetical protein
MKRANLNVWMQFSYFFDYVPRCFFKKTRHQSFQHWTNTTCREGRWTGAGKNVLPTDYRMFLAGDRRTKCLGGDRQRTVWCLQQHQLCYLHNKRTKCVLTVSCRNPGKLGCPVSRKTVGTMVDVCQVMIAHTIIRNFLTMKLELPSPLLSDSPFLSSKRFFLLWFSIVRNAKSRPTFWHDFSSSVWPQILFSKSVKNQNRDLPTSRVSDKVFDESFCEFFIPTEDCFCNKIDGSRKHQETIQKWKVFEVLNECDFILSIQQSNSKIGKTKKLLTREMGNPTGEEIGVPVS